MLESWCLKNNRLAVIGFSASVLLALGVGVFLSQPRIDPVINSLVTAHSSSRENTLYQPKPISKKLHCRAQGRQPDPDCTPGAMVAGVGTEHVCVPGYAQSVRSVTDSEKRAVYAAYDIALHAPNQYEVDHLISLELGGSNDIANLWPEPAEPTPGFHEKDQVENELHKEVCDGKMTINQAQRIISTDWFGFYKTMEQ